MVSASLQFYTDEKCDGVLVRVRKWVKVADKDREHTSATCKAVKALREKEFNRISTSPSSTAEGMAVVDSWETPYLTYCEKEWNGTGMRASMVRGLQAGSGRGVCVTHHDRA
jgi:hypothetical protein